MNVFRITPNRLKASVWVCLVPFALNGCSGIDEEFAQLQHYIEAIESQPVPPIKPLPELRHYDIVEYAAQDLRSPFELPAADKPAQNPLAPDEDRPKEPLEHYPLDTLKMVGTLSREGQLWGIIKATSDNTVHIVQSGSFLGQNYGKIVGIGQDHIELLEVFPDSMSEWNERNITLNIEDED